MILLAISLIRIIELRSLSLLLILIVVIMVVTTVLTTSVMTMCEAVIALWIWSTIKSTPCTRNFLLLVLIRYTLYQLRILWSGHRFYVSFNLRLALARLTQHELAEFFTLDLTINLVCQLTYML